MEMGKLFWGSIFSYKEIV